MSMTASPARMGGVLERDAALRRQLESLPEWQRRELAKKNRMWARAEAERLDPADEDWPAEPQQDPAKVPRLHL